MVTFRKSKKFGPLRFTVSPHGVSTSAKVPGARLSVNSHGEVRRTLSVPGTGIYDTKKLGGTNGKEPAGPVWSLVESPEQVVATLTHSLAPEQQRAAYDGYREDPEDTLEAMREGLVAAGWGRDELAYLLPALRAHMDLWTTSPESP